MKILFITDGITPFVVGGMQKHSQGLIKSLLSLDVQIFLVHCVNEGSKIPSEEEVRSALGGFDSSRLEILTLRFPKGGVFPGHYIKSSFLYSSIVFEMVKERLHEFDFIYSKGFTGWFFINKKRTDRSIPPIGVKFHGYEMLQPGGDFSMKLKKYLLKGPAKWISLHADFVFSYGSKITEIIKNIGVKTDNIIEVATGIDEEWLQINEQQKGVQIKFLFIGRYERRKGIEELNDVISMRSIEPNVKFEFIGPIPHSKRISRTDIQYHGEIRDKKEIMNLMDGCDVLVCPSHAEGMPNVILEAMARGLAVIATDVGASNVLVEDGRTGFLIQAADKAALSKAIQQVINLGKNRVQEIGRAGKMKAEEQFSWASIGKTTKNLIEQRIRYH